MQYLPEYHCHAAQPERACLCLCPPAKPACRDPVCCIPCMHRWHGPSAADPCTPACQQERVELDTLCHMHHGGVCHDRGVRPAAAAPACCHMRPRKQLAGHRRPSWPQQQVRHESSTVRRRGRAAALHVWMAAVPSVCDSVGWPAALRRRSGRSRGRGHSVTHAGACGSAGCQPGQQPSSNGHGYYRHSNHHIDVISESVDEA